MHRMLLFACMSVLLGAGAFAEVRDMSADLLTSAERWQVGGNRINYTLGDSSLAASAEQTRGDLDRSLKLTYDFTNPDRRYISAYHTGPAIPGICQEVSIWIYGDGSRRLRFEIEDARGRLFRNDVGRIDWEG